MKVFTSPSLGRQWGTERPGLVIQRAGPGLPAVPRPNDPDRVPTAEQWQWLVENRKLVVFAVRDGLGRWRNRFDWEDCFSFGIQPAVRALQTHDPAGGMSVASWVSLAVRRDAHALRFNGRWNFAPGDNTKRSRHRAALLSGGLQIEDVPDTPGDRDNTELFEQVRRWFDRLGDREKRVLTAYVIERNFLVSVAVELGVSRERVRQIASRLLTELRKELGLPPMVVREVYRGGKVHTYHGTNPFAHARGPRRKKKVVGSDPATSEQGV